MPEPKVGDPCPYCGETLTEVANCFFWDRWFPGLVCKKCKKCWNHPDDPIITKDMVVCPGGDQCKCP